MDPLLVIGRGRLLADRGTAEFLDRHDAASPQEAFMRLTAESVEFRGERRGEGTRSEGSGG